MKEGLTCADMWVSNRVKVMCVQFNYVTIGRNRNRQGVEEGEGGGRGEYCSISAKLGKPETLN